MSTDKPNAFDRGYTAAESDLALDRLMREPTRPTWAERLDAYERGLIEKGYSQALAAQERRDMEAAVGPDVYAPENRDLAALGEGAPRNAPAPHPPTDLGKLQAAMNRGDVPGIAEAMGLVGDPTRRVESLPIGAPAPDVREVFPSCVRPSRPTRREHFTAMSDGDLLTAATMAGLHSRAYIIDALAGQNWDEPWIDEGGQP